MVVAGGVIKVVGGSDPGRHMHEEWSEISAFAHVLSNRGSMSAPEAPSIFGQPLQFLAESRVEAK